MDDYTKKLLTQPGSREMTEEELLVLYQQLEQQVEKNFWFTFEPRGIQTKVLNCFKKRKGFQIVMCIGGNQLGKSFASLHFLMDMLTRRNEYRVWGKEPLHIAWFSKHRRFQRATIDTNILKYCGEYIKNGLDGRPGIDSQSGAFTFLKFKNEPENGYYGDLIQFETGEMAAKDIEGYVLSACIFDDIEDKWEHFKYANQRLVSKEAPMLMSMLPPSDTELPLYTHVLKHYFEDDKEEFEFINFAVATIDDYAAIHGWDKVEYFRKIYTPEEFDRKIGGKPGKVTDMVYPFVKSKHVISPIEIPKHWRRDISIDYATSDNKWVKAQTSTTKELKKAATVAVFFAIPPPGEEIKLNDGRVLMPTEDKPLYFVYKEYYWANEKYKRLAQDHGKEICKLFDREEKFQSILIDCAVDDTAYSEMKKVFDAYKQPFFRKILYGSKTRFKSAKNKELGGHELVKQVIGNDQFYTFNTCEHFLREEENYKIDKNTQQPRVWGDHCLSGKTLVDTIKGQIPIKDLVGKEGYLFSEGGRIRKFYDVRQTGEKEIWEIEFSNGKKVECSSHHPFKLIDNTWCTSELLMEGDMVQLVNYGRSDCTFRKEAEVLWNKLLSSWKVFQKNFQEKTRLCFSPSYCLGTSLWQDSGQASYSPQGWKQEQQPGNQLGTRFNRGAFISPLERKDERSQTIKEGPGTDGSDKTIDESLAQKQRRQSLAFRSWQEALEESKTDRKEMLSMWKKIFYKMLENFPFPLLPSKLQDEGTQAKVIRITRKLQRQNVFNLEVEDTACFSVNGGIIVSNCMDARRYFLATLPKYKDPEYLTTLEENDNYVTYDEPYLSDDCKVSNYSFNSQDREVMLGI